MPHLPPAHHETSKYDSPNEQAKDKTNKMSRIRIQTSPSQWFITIKPRNWPLGFSISSLMSPLITKDTKFEVRIQNPWSIARRPKSQEKLKKVI
jgi:hypothetical protein